MKIEIQGQDTINATNKLLTVEGVEGTYQPIDEVKREGTLATIATIIGITSGILAIAENIYKCK